jgi:superfamily II DNA or RNA helicase
VIACIVDDKTIFFDQITVGEEVSIDKAFSVTNPGARYIDTGENQKFDGTYHKYNKARRTLPRPLLGELRAFCRQANLPLVVRDLRPPPKYPAPNPESIGKDFLPGITLDDHQLRHIRACCGAEVGIHDCTTGGGKGEMIAGIAKLFDCPTVIIAEQLVVIDQLKQRLELREVVEEVGLFCSGVRPNGQRVICGSVQSLVIPPPPQRPVAKEYWLDSQEVRKLAKLKKYDLDDPANTGWKEELGFDGDFNEAGRIFYKAGYEKALKGFDSKLKGYRTRAKNAKWLREQIAKCDLLMIDEADKATSAIYKSLCRHLFKGRRRYGFSGTPFDKDKPVNNMVVKELLGSVICKTEREELESIGRIIPVEYTALVLGSRDGRFNKATFDSAVTEFLIENPKFHQLVVGLACQITTGQKGTMILVESIPLGNKIEELIGQVRPGSAKFISGATAKKERRAALAAYEERKVPILIGSKILKRGLDLKGGCENLIIATGGKLSSEVDQMVGRAVRRNKEGIAQIYDFFLLYNFYLYSHSRKRLKAVVEMGYRTRVKFGGGITMDGAEFVRRRFQLPKNFQPKQSKTVKAMDI